MCPSHISGCIDSNVGQTNSGMRGFVHFCIQVLSCIHHACIAYRSTNADLLLVEAITLTVIAQFLLS